MVVVDIGPWFLSSVEVVHGYSCEPKVVVETGVCLGPGIPWADITLQLNLSKVKPCVLCVLEGSPLPIQVLLVQYSPHAPLI